jgi:HEPN domain-containing protein
VRSGTEAEWRLRVAREHLDVARRSLGAGVLLPAADNARKSVENAIKAAIACYGPVPRTHDAAASLSGLLQAGAAVPAASRADVAQLVTLGQRHGLVEHLRLSYGDEQAGQTPAQLVTAASAQSSIADAEEAVRIAGSLVAAVVPRPPQP